MQATSPTSEPGRELVDGKHEAIISSDTYEINQKVTGNFIKRVGEVRRSLIQTIHSKLIAMPNCVNPLCICTENWCGRQITSLSLLSNSMQRQI